MAAKQILDTTHTVALGRESEQQNKSVGHLVTMALEMDGKTRYCGICYGLRRHDLQKLRHATSYPSKKKHPPETGEAADTLNGCPPGTARLRELWVTQDVLHQHCRRHCRSSLSPMVLHCYASKAVGAHPRNCPPVRSRAVSQSPDIVSSILRDPGGL